MLGGSFGIALLRNIMGALLFMGTFLLLDRPRFSMKKTVFYYSVFGGISAALYGGWYLFDKQMFVRFAGITLIPLIGIFCILLSADLLYLSIYKLTLGFYLLAVTVFLGIDGSRLWFGSSVWADIALRVVIEPLFLCFIIKSVRPRFQKGREFLSEVMDLPSAVTLIAVVMIAGVMAYWPDNHVLSKSRVACIAVMMTMAGIIQWMTFRMYLYRGREYYGRIEKELMEMNELLLRRQLNQIKAADAKPNGAERFCANTAVSGILSAYQAYALEEKIRVEIHAELDEDIAVRELDMMAILVSVFETAIYACKTSVRQALECGISDTELPRINLFVLQNKNKVVVLCQNTCASQWGQRAYPEDWQSKAESIRKVVRYYNGEIECSAEERVCTTKILLDIPKQRIQEK